MVRIQPLDPPFAPDVARQLESMMPPGVPPILLFRTFAKNLPMASAMRGWGSYELGKSLSLGMRHRELVIDRTCANLGCEYEWGVHVAFFAARVELDEQQIVSLTHGDSSDPCWEDEADRLILRAVDSLCDTADVPDELWDALCAVFSEGQLLDLCMLCGWYHAIGFTARVARVDLEDGSPTFESVRQSS